MKTTIRLPKVKIVEVPPLKYRGLYRLEGKNVPKKGWVIIHFNGFQEEEGHFRKVQNHFVRAMVHQCQNDTEIRYTWSSRKYRPPAMPCSCPSCKKRLDYVSTVKKAVC